MASATEIKRDIRSEQEHFDRYYAERRGGAGSAKEGSPEFVAAFRQRALHPGSLPLDFFEYTFHLLGDLRGKRVLDVGCGGGWITRLLAAKKARVVAFDVSLEGCRLTRDKLAEEGAEGCLVTVQDAHAMALPANTFDAVLVTGVLHHLDLSLVAPEIHRVLKPGGRLVFYEPLKYGAVMWFLRRVWLRLHGMQEYAMSDHEDALRDEAILSIRSVFRTGEIHRLNFLAKTNRLKNRFGIFANALRWIDFLLLSVCPFLRRFCTCAVCRFEK